ncbi:MAG: hypothetical protein V1755_08395 [Chloroflexota bacterium]
MKEVASLYLSTQTLTCTLRPPAICRGTYMLQLANPFSSVNPIHVAVTFEDQTTLMIFPASPTPLVFIIP